MRAATLESRLEEPGVLRSFSRPRVSNDNPYWESLFRTAKYRPDYPSRPFASKDEACQWVSSFVDWYNHRHRHSGIKFVTPQQRHNGDAVEICRHRAVVYEQARQRHPRRWSRSTRCWCQPEVVWINPPAPETALNSATLTMAACTAAAASSFLAVTAPSPTRPEQTVKLSGSSRRSAGDGPTPWPLRTPRSATTGWPATCRSITSSGSTRPWAGAHPSSGSLSYLVDEAGGIQ